MDLRNAQHPQPARGVAAARESAGRQAALNARIMTGVAQPSRPTLEQRARRWWDLPAKYELADKVSDEEHRLHNGHHNDDGDAMRHADWSRRVASGADPISAALFGIGHELKNIAVDHHPISESVMDMHNNLEGVASAVQKRPIQRSNLQNAPISVRGEMFEGENRYDDLTPDRTSYPSRPYGNLGSARNGYKDGPARPSGSQRYPAY